MEERLKSDVWLSGRRPRKLRPLHPEQYLAGRATTGWHSHPGHSLIIITSGIVTDYESENGRRCVGGYATRPSNRRRSSTRVVTTSIRSSTQAARLRRGMRSSSSHQGPCDESTRLSRRIARSRQAEEVRVVRSGPRRSRSHFRQIRPTMTVPRAVAVPRRATSRPSPRDRRAAEMRQHSVLDTGFLRDAPRHPRLMSGAREWTSSAPRHSALSRQSLSIAGGNITECTSTSAPAASFTRFWDGAVSPEI
jgi:hypothetical protein